MLRCCHPWFLVAPEHNSMPCPFLRPSPLLDAALCRDKRCESSTAASRFTACAGARRHPCATTGLEHPAPPGTIQHAAGAAAATRSNRHALADMCHSCISAAFAAALQQHHLEQAIQQCSAAGCCVAGQLAIRCPTATPASARMPCAEWRAVHSTSASVGHVKPAVQYAGLPGRSL